MAIERRRAIAPTVLPIITPLSLLVEVDVVGDVWEVNTVSVVLEVDAVGMWEDEGDVDVFFSWDVIYDVKAGVSDDEASVSSVDIVDKDVE